ncbi:hypothetical protein SAFG77S_00894 [Streptomyces afghaniensis]
MITEAEPTGTRPDHDHGVARASVAVPYPELVGRGEFGEQDRFVERDLPRPPGRWSARGNQRQLGLGPDFHQD